MQDLAGELRRITLLRGWVNKPYSHRFRTNDQLSLSIVLNLCHGGSSLRIISVNADYDNEIAVW
jgi:hypothetical protein